MPRRRGQIIPRGAGGWVIRITLPADTEGKRRTWNRTVHGTKRDAEKALTRALSDLDHGRLEDPSRMPLAEWIQEWLESRRQDLRPRSWESYHLWNRQYIVPTLGRVRLADLKPRDVQRAVTALASGEATGAPLSPGTIRLAMSVLRPALAAAVRLRMIPTSPADGVRLPRNPRKGPRRVLSPEETARLGDAVAGHRLGSLWLLSLALALRPGEALALKWEDVSWEERLLHVRRSVWVPRTRGARAELTAPKTASSVRVLPLSPELVALLKGQRARQARERLAAGEAWQDQGLIFPGAGGGILLPNSTGRSLSRVLRAAGLGHLSPHGLRHTGATSLVVAGIDPAHVAALLGHSSVKTTLDIYVKVQSGRLAEGVGLLSNLLGLKAEGS